MCGRFAFFSPAEAVAAAFGANIQFQYQPRYNIAPSQQVTLLRLDDGGQLIVDQCRWGLVPFWAKDPAIGNRMINARAETIAEKPSYRQSFARRRCLILADGFYEWHVDAAGKSKTPYFISRGDGQPFGMAGLWDEWQRDDDDALRSCTIITTQANAFMRELHHRMPVLLADESVKIWFDNAAGKDDLLPLLLDPQDVQLRAWPVSRNVNNPVNEGVKLIARAGD
jgi:putative SOS response-associated peptidase YedK